MKVVLLQPPFFRCMGSHNNQVQLDLAYVSRFLDDAHIEHVVVNADHGFGGQRYVPWRELFKREENLRLAADGEHPILDEAVEYVLGFEPEVVVISGGDTTIPTKNIGSPYIAAQVSKKIRNSGVRTVGIGPVFMKETGPFAKWFDAIFTSAVNRSIVDFLVSNDIGFMGGVPVGVVPCFDHVVHGRPSDLVMTAFGCAYDCSFCLFPVVYGKNVTFQLVETVLEDMEKRSKLVGNEMYLGDAIFPLNMRRLRVLADELEYTNYRFRCESRVDAVKPESLDLMRRIGVRVVKVGLESLDDTDLVGLNKKQSVRREAEGLKLLKEYGMKVVGYLIFGANQTVDGMKTTIKRANDLLGQKLVDHFVVNVAAYEHIDWDHRYDAHFSLYSARQQGILEEVIEGALKLQEGKINPMEV